MKSPVITVACSIAAPLSKVWTCFTLPQHIVQWNAASDDWHTLHAENNLKIKGHFNYRMEAKDGSAGFNLTGTYDNVVLHKKLLYTLADARKVIVTFEYIDKMTILTQSFESENENEVALQQRGWQAILNNFKEYVESN